MFLSLYRSKIHINERLTDLYNKPPTANWGNPGRRLYNKFKMYEHFGLGRKVKEDWWLVLAYCVNMNINDCQPDKGPKSLHLHSTHGTTTQMTGDLDVRCEIWASKPVSIYTALSYCNTCFSHLVYNYMYTNYIIQISSPCSSWQYSINNYWMIYNSHSYPMTLYFLIWSSLST